MAHSTKIFLITSNEDIIQQFQFTQNANVKIIDLDQQQFNKDNFDLLKQLSANDVGGNPMSKRSLDSFEQQQTQTKPSKARRKSDEFVCVVCGDRAIGFNYNVLSCASCKAFFRRNAFHDLSKLRCLKDNGQCSIEHDARRKCQRCRLERCLSMGMRKDLISSYEEKQRRKQNLEENRIKTSNRQSFSLAPKEIENLNDCHLIPSESLSEEDWSIIQYAQTNLFNAVNFHSAFCSDCLDLSDRLSALISWSEFISETTLGIIGYFRQIKQFESLDNDDRFILIKYNILVSISVLKCFSYRPTGDCCSHDSSDAAERNRQFYRLCGISISIRNTLISLIASLARLTKQDPTILSLLLNTIIFSPCLSMNENEPSLKNPSAVHQAQSYYTKLLWNYLINRWGADQTQSFFIEFMSIILRLQTVMKHFRDAFRDQYQSLNSLDQIAPLMQSVLHIS